MKNAKKSMFITTVLMVAVLIVAVSTATFAWYTASGSGTATGALLTSAESTDANIGLGWSKETATSSTIALTNGTSKFAPMAVYAMDGEDMVKLDATKDGGYDYDDVLFATATVDDQNKFNAPSTNATPWVVSDGTTANGFYVRNNNQNAGATVKIGISFAQTGTPAADLPNNDILCVGVFVDGKLEGIFTKQTAYAAGSVEQGQLKSTVDDQGTAFIKGATATIDIELDAYNAAGTGDNAYIQVKAWFDGTALDQTKADMDAGFTLTFAGTTITA